MREFVILESLSSEVKTSAFQGCENWTQLDRFRLQETEKDGEPSNRVSRCIPRRFSVKLRDFRLLRRLKRVEQRHIQNSKEPGMTKANNARGGSHKMKMLTLVDRTTKRAKSIVVVDLKKSTLIPILLENIAREAYVMTDEARQYQGIGAGKVFEARGWTNHSAGEYVNLEDREMHTNTVEGFYRSCQRKLA
jgi:transposase-like protein